MLGLLVVEQRLHLMKDRFLLHRCLRTVENRRKVDKNRHSSRTERLSKHTDNILRDPLDEGKIPLLYTQMSEDRLQLDLLSMVVVQMWLL